MIDSTKLAALAVVLPMLTSPALAQDVRGIEICTVEKQIDRRTSCLQSNVEFLHSTLTKQTRDSSEKLAAANREIAGLKDALVKLRSELDELKKTKPAAPTTPPAAAEPKR